MSCVTKFGLYVFSITVSAYFSPSLTTLCGRCGPRRLTVDVGVIRLSPHRLPVCCRRNTKVRLLPWKSLKGFSSRVHLRFILLRLKDTGWARVLDLLTQVGELSPESRLNAVKPSLAVTLQRGGIKQLPAFFSLNISWENLFLSAYDELLHTLQELKILLS